MAGLALAWLLADDRVTQVVVGPVRPDHLTPVDRGTGMPDYRRRQGRDRRGIQVVELSEIEAARTRIEGAAIRTPLVRLYADAPAEIYVKLENLQPVNSFKIRGATNAVALASPEERAKGLVTASAGNMAQGVAWAARAIGVPATIVVPEQAPQAKLAAIERLGGQVRKLPYDDWWNILVTGHVDGIDGPVRAPGFRSGGDRGQRDDRPGDSRGSARRRRGRHPVRRGRPDDRNRERDQGAAAQTKIITAEPATGCALARRSRPGILSTPAIAHPSSTARAAAGCWTSCGRRSAGSSTMPWRSRWMTSPRPSGSSPSA